MNCNRLDLSKICRGKVHFSGTDERTDRTTVEKTADKETKKNLSFVSLGDFVRDCSEVVLSGKEQLPKKLQISSAKRIIAYLIIRLQ